MKRPGFAFCTRACAVTIVAGLMGLATSVADDQPRRESIPPLPEIEPHVATRNPDLVKLRALLVEERKTLRTQTEEHNVACRRVQQDTAAEAECRRSLTALKTRLDAHIKDSKVYNGSHQQAIQLSASQKPAPPPPHTDTSVVDTTGVSSGLPKGVESAIDGAYAKAPPGVRERVRKGFQAVMLRDWRVARAWFQDALNLDPNNIGLKRLVALVDYSRQPDQMRVPVDVRNHPAGLGGGPKMNVAATQPHQANPSPATTGTRVPMPAASDLEILFPGLRTMKDREAPRFRTLPDGSSVQLPLESDVEFLFFPTAQPPASKPVKTR